MTKITIVVSPAFDRRGKRRHDRFDARLKDSDEIICETTRQPLLDASRVFLRRGLCPSTAVCMVHAHAPTVVAMWATIDVAAQYDIMGEKFIRRKPIAGPMPGSGTESVGLAESRVLCKTEAPAKAPHKGSRHAATPPSPTSSPASPTSSPPASSTSSPATSSASSYPQKEK
jgi:hypothetical protein